MSSVGARPDPAQRGDAASCSALGACLLVGARRVRSAEPELSAMLTRFGAQLQRYAVGVRAVRVIERYAAGTTDAADAAGQPGHREGARKAAASRRARADAALRQAADAARRDFESLTRSPNPDNPPTPVDHAW